MYTLEVCDECDYQWDEGKKPHHRETCSHYEPDTPDEEMPDWMKKELEE